MENKKIEFMKNFINDREKLMRILLWGSVALDIFLVLCFVIGFALGMGSSEIGFFMIGIIFKYKRKKEILFYYFVFLVQIIVYWSISLWNILYWQDNDCCGIKNYIKFKLY